MLEPKIQRVVGEIRVEVAFFDACKSEIEVLDAFARVWQPDNGPDGSWRRRFDDDGSRVETVLDHITELVLFTNQVEEAGLSEKPLVGFMHSGEDFAHMTVSIIDSDRECQGSACLLMKKTEDNNK